MTELVTERVHVWFDTKFKLQWVESGNGFGSRGQKD